MLIIVGLGNPGEKYQNNRHNVGFQFVDYLIENLKNPNGSTSSPSRAKSRDNSQIINIKFQKNKYLDSAILRLVYDRTEVVLAKPTTFMNNSGQAVKKISKVYGLKSNNLVVVHDDLDIPLGKFKIQKGTGPQLHNGLESIEQHLKTKDFWRLRIGVDNRVNSPERIHTEGSRSSRRATSPERVVSEVEPRVEGETYVLNDFLPTEKNILMKEVFPKTFNRLKLPFLPNL